MPNQIQMEYKGTLRKMKVAMEKDIQYWLNLNHNPVLGLNQYLGQPIEMEWTGRINCIACAKNLTKTYGQGFCYNCLMESAEASPCIMRPELCEAHLGKGRDEAWEEANHNQPHIVYLAQTSGVKVGVTRKTHMPTRWLDQGAWRALTFAEVPYRYLAGLMEVEIKQFISDRTDWRRMLIGEKDNQDLLVLREMIVSFLPEKLAPYVLPEVKIVEMNYPVLQYPATVKALKFEDARIFRSVLTGIRGQYLYFDGDKVINMRKYSGYEIAVRV